MSTRYGRTTQKCVSFVLVLCVCLSSIFLPWLPVRAESLLIVAATGNQTSTLPVDSLGYQEFRTEIKIFNYSGSGTVCLSQNADRCDPIQVDDGVKVWMNDNFVGDFQSRTQPIAVTIPSTLLRSGSNTLKITLYDMQGPYRGSGNIYLVTGSTASGWYNGCTPGALEVLRSAELRIPKTPDHELVWKYGGSIQRCSNFNVTLSSPTGPYGLSVNGSANATNYTLDFNDKGEVVSASASFQLSELQPTTIFNAGVDFAEWGFRFERNFGTQQIGIVGKQFQEALDRYKRRQPPPAPRFVQVPELSAYPMTKVATVLATAYIAATLIGKQVFARYVLLTPAFEEWYKIHGGQPSVVASDAVQSSGVVQSAALAPDVQAAVNQRWGDLASFTSFGSITTRDSISAHTVFEFMVPGFTPNSPAYVTFGLPGSAEDFYVLLLKSDGSGTVRGTIRMPTKAEVPLGKYLLTALDVAAMESSVNAVFANPQSATLAVRGAAKLIDVVQDTTPPVTTAFARGPLDVNRVFKDNVVVSFTATDDLSGVDHTEYSLNNGQSWTSIPVTGTFTLSGNGITSFLYRSVDRWGNVEAVKNSGPIAISKYVVFANDPTTSLSIVSNTSVVITGTLHTNGRANISMNNTVRVNGVLQAALSGSTVTYNTNTAIPIVTSPVIPMLSYPLAMYESQATVVYPSSVVINNTTQTLTGIHYVKGDLTIRGTQLGGDLVFVATGNIYDQSTSTSIVSSDPNNGITLYAGRDIQVKGTSHKAVGLYYAPNGTISVNGATSLNLNGSLVGKSVVFQGSTRIAVKYAAGFPATTYQLPLTAAQEPFAAASILQTDVDWGRDITSFLYLPLISNN